MRALTTTAAAPAPASNAYRWRIALLLGIGVLVNYFDRVNLSVAITPLRSEFGLSTVAIGYLLSTYSWTYVVLQIPSGRLLDQFGVKRVGRASAFLWSIASFLAGAANGFTGLVSARLLLGVAEAPTFPGNVKAISGWFPRERRGLPTADLRCRRKVRLGHRRPDRRGRGALLGMACQLRGYRVYQPGIFRAVLVRLSRSGRQIERPRAS